MTEPESCNHIQKVADIEHQDWVYFCQNPVKGCVHRIDNYSEAYCLHPDRKKLAEKKDERIL